MNEPFSVKSIHALRPQAELSLEQLRDVLGLASLEVAVGIIAAWTPNERLLAYDWAWRQHLRASDNSVRDRPMPWFLAMGAALSAPGAGITIPDELSALFSNGTGTGAQP